MNQLKYNCEICVFRTNNKQHYNRHIQSIRHNDKNNNTNIFAYRCNSCNKKFKCHSGLYQHKVKCNKNINISINQPEIEESINLIKSVNELKIMISEIKANQLPTTITNNTNNHNNNNINLILNDNFKNAKNFIDMINGIPHLHSYPRTISSTEYVDTIVKMLKNEIDKFPITERPIQCIKNEDENQKILHIRHHDEWYKETELDWTRQIHNSSLGDDDAPEESDEKIIFHAIKIMEKHIIHRIGELYGKDAQRDYTYELDHPSNKVRIIKYILEHINIEKEDLIKIIDETYNKLKTTI